MSMSKCKECFGTEKVVQFADGKTVDCPECMARGLWRFGLVAWIVILAFGGAVLWLWK